MCVFKQLPFVVAFRRFFFFFETRARMGAMKGDEKLWKEISDATFFLGLSKSG